MTYLFAWAFIVLAPFVVGAARYCLALRRADPASGAALALAWVTGAAALIGIFLAVVSGLYIAGHLELVRILQPGVLPAFLALEVLLIVLPLYLRWLQARRGRSE